MLFFIFVLFYRGNHWNKINKQAGNENRHDLQGLQKLKSIAIYNYTQLIWHIYMILLNKHQK